MSQRAEALTILRGGCFWSSHWATRPSFHAVIGARKSDLTLAFRFFRRYGGASNECLGICVV
jgi:hypothetical protein